MQQSSLEYESCKCPVDAASTHSHSHSAASGHQSPGNGYSTLFVTPHIYTWKHVHFCCVINQISTSVLLIAASYIIYIKRFQDISQFVMYSVRNIFQYIQYISLIPRPSRIILGEMPSRTYVIKIGIWGFAETEHSYILWHVQSLGSRLVGIQLQLHCLGPSDKSVTYHFSVCLQLQHIQCPPVASL